MALMEVHYSSFAMGTNITLNVFVPTPGSSEAITDMNQSRKYDYEHGLPVLYLLHGAYGDAFGKCDRELHGEALHLYRKAAGEKIKIFYLYF